MAGLTDRHIAYLAYCNTPRTYREAATYFDVHWQSARRVMVDLKQRGLLETYPLWKGNEKRFIISDAAQMHTGGVKLDPAIRVQWEGEIVTPANVAGVLLAGNAQNRVPLIGKVLLELAKRSFHKAENPNTLYTGSSTQVINMKEFLTIVVLPWLDEIRFLIDQLILNEEVWKVDEESWEKLGFKAADAEGIKGFLDNFDELIAKQLAGK